MRNPSFILILSLFCATLSYAQPTRLVAAQSDNSSATLDLQNTEGFWHISGPRSFENNNNLSVYWNDGTFKRYLTILDDGKIGIGTTTPQDKLDVLGNVRATGKFVLTGLGALAQSGSDINLWSNQNLIFSTAGSLNNRLTINNTGNVGIGTTNPSTKLQVQDGEITVLSTNNAALRLLSPDTYSGILFSDVDGNSRIYYRGATGTFDIGGSGSNVANKKLHVHGGTSIGEGYIGASVPINGLAIEGEVGIGTTNLSQDGGNSKLFVDGKILCEEVKVIADVVPDYVFQKYYTGTSSIKADYVMPTLEEVEAFTKEHHHLPEVPSAKDIEEEGLELKKMTTLLLQKVEELTLYTIEQEKRIKALEAELAKKE